MLVEGVSDLQPTDEHSGSHIVVGVIHQGYLALKITDIVFEAPSSLHLDCEKVVTILLELPSKRIIVIESMLHLFESPERLSRECIEPVVGNALETGWEHTTQEQVIVKVDHHLVLVLTEVLDGVSRSRVGLEAPYHELHREAVRSDILR